MVAWRIISLDDITRVIIQCTMIESFASSEAEKIFRASSRRSYPWTCKGGAAQAAIPGRCAEDLRDLLAPPGNRLEELQGDRAGQHSIRINDQWRICFRWIDGKARDVEIVDYHSEADMDRLPPFSRRGAAGRLHEPVGLTQYRVGKGHRRFADADQPDRRGNAAITADTAYAWPGILAPAKPCGCISRPVMISKSLEETNGRAYPTGRLECCRRTGCSSCRDEAIIAMLGSRRRSTSGYRAACRSQLGKQSLTE